MSNFSERFGYSKPRMDLNHDEMPDSLRAGLWDCAAHTFFPYNAADEAVVRPQYSDHFDFLTARLWLSFYHEPTEDRPSSPRRARVIIRDRFWKSSFNKVYDFLEFLAELVESDEVSEIFEPQAEFIAFCNKILSRERAAFRFSGSKLIEVTDPVELEELNIAAEENDSESVRKHIFRAAELYSHRPDPDYRNSIKESISAVEAAVQYVVGKKSHGVSRPLKDVWESFPIHPSLRDGFEKLYAYTSDAEGIRHALMDAENLSQEDARYMLVSCSAFSNYLISKKIKQGQN